MQQNMMIPFAARLRTSRVVWLVLPVALQVVAVPHADLAGLPRLDRRHPLLRRQLLKLRAVLHTVAFSTLPAGHPPALLGGPDRVDRRLLNRRLVLSTALPEATATAPASTESAFTESAATATACRLHHLLLLRSRLASRDGRLTRQGGHHLVPLPHVPPKRRWLLLYCHLRCPHPPSRLLRVRPFLKHRPHVVDVKNDVQHPGVLDDVEGPDEQVHVLLQPPEVAVPNLLGRQHRLHQVVQKCVVANICPVQVLPGLPQGWLEANPLLVHRPQAPLHQDPLQRVPLQPRVILHVVLIPLSLPGHVVERLPVEHGPVLRPVLHLRVRPPAEPLGHLL